MASTLVSVKTVVVADDTAFVRERFRTALETAGHKAFYAPHWDQTGRDWVLVLDDATKTYGEPGAK